MHALETVPAVTASNPDRTGSAASDARMGSSERRTAWLALVVLVPFLAFSLHLVETQGYLGFLYLAARERWGLQMLLDLVISCSLVLTWLVPDARRRGLASWPWIALTLTLGSIGLLGYLVRRGFSGSGSSAAGR
jgi:hypothetical protein